MPFFFGASQKTVTTKFMQQAHSLGDRFIPISVEGSGKNALDFHIAFYLGEHLAKAPHTSCVILSKDKGFDPLFKHLSSLGLRVRRVTNLAEAFPPPASQHVRERSERPIDTMPASLAWLREIEKPKRPRKCKARLAHLHAFREEDP